VRIEASQQRAHFALDCNLKFLVGLGGGLVSVVTPKIACRGEPCCIKLQDQKKNKRAVDARGCSGGMRAATSKSRGGSASCRELSPSQVNEVFPRCSTSKEAPPLALELTGRLMSGLKQTSGRSRDFFYCVGEYGRFFFAFRMPRSTTSRIIVNDVGIFSAIYHHLKVVKIGLEVHP
jgi:hypothetical protein